MNCKRILCMQPHMQLQSEVYIHGHKCHHENACHGNIGKFYHDQWLLVAINKLRAEFCYIFEDTSWQYICVFLAWAQRMSTVHIFSIGLSLGLILSLM